MATSGSSGFTGQSMPTSGTVTKMFVTENEYLNNLCSHIQQDKRFSFKVADHEAKVKTGNGKKINPNSANNGQQNGCRCDGGSDSTEIQLLTNYFSFTNTKSKYPMSTGFIVHDHVVKFGSGTAAANRSLKFDQEAKNLIGTYLYEKPHLYAFKHLGHWRTKAIIDGDSNSVEICWTRALALNGGLYDKFWRQLMTELFVGDGLKMHGVGGHFYYDKPYRRAMSISMFGAGIFLSAGFKPAIKRHVGDQMFLQLELVYELFSSVNLLEIIYKIYIAHAFSAKTGSPVAAVAGALVGRAVFTSCPQAGDATYVITDIDWIANPNRIYQQDREGKNAVALDDMDRITYAQYFKQVWGVTLRDFKQPILVVTPTKKPHQSTSTNRHAPLVRLAPEFCFLVGLTEEMRREKSVVGMEALDKKLDPATKVARFLELRQHLNRSPNLLKLNLQGVKLSDQLVTCTGHVLPKEKLVFGCKYSIGTEKPYKIDLPDDNNEWPTLFKDNPMVNPVPITKWIIIYNEDLPGEHLVASYKLLISAASSLGIKISGPLLIYYARGDPASYKMCLDSLLPHQRAEPLQFLFIILPNSGPGNVKFRKMCTELTAYLTVQWGVVSEFCKSSDVSNLEEMDRISRRLMAQINVKIGGEGWRLLVPKTGLFEDLMIVGIDMVPVVTGPVHRYNTVDVNSCIIGAAVASMNSDLTKYYSTTFKFNRNGEIGNLIKIQIFKCLEAYLLKNRKLPQRLICYREAVADCDLEDVYEIEVDQVKALLASKYLPLKLEPPELTYIVVNQKPVTRLFTNGPDADADNGKFDIKNAPPGTVVDKTITMTEGNDFYLISQGSTRDTTSPVHYNVLHSTSGLDLSTLERLTFKFCHLGYNQYGATPVPAPCYYAHKLVSFDTRLGLVTDEYYHADLEHTLYYL